MVALNMSHNFRSNQNFFFVFFIRHEEGRICSFCNYDCNVIFNRFIFGKVIEIISDGGLQIKELVVSKDDIKRLRRDLTIEKMEKLTPLLPTTLAPKG